MQEKEIWKDIGGYEGMYQVSSFGRVKSLERKSQNTKRHIKEHFIKQFDDTNGYLRFSMFKNKKKVTLSIHRIVAETFIPNPNNYPCVNHKDGNKQNNCIENLEWCTYKYNTEHAWKTGLAKPKYNGYGVRAERIIQYNLENIPIAIYMSCRMASKINNISYKNISECVRGKSKTAGGYKWKFLKKGINIWDMI